MHPYPISLQELKTTDFPKHLHFYKCLLRSQIQETFWCWTIFFTDAVWFHWKGRGESYINAQNYRICSAKKPDTYQDVALHPEKVGVWCPISRHCIYFIIILNELTCVEMLEEVIFNNFCNLLFININFVLFAYFFWVL